MKEFSISTQVFFGEGALDELCEIQGKRVFIVTDKFIEKSGAIEHIKKRLASCETAIFSDVVPDPPIEVVAAGLKAMQQFGAQVVVAVGGGSSLDAAKAIRELDRRVTDGNSAISKCFAIPTTSGTGSEVTQFSVITDAQKGLKYPISSRSLRPPVAILDPELVVTAPPAVTADTGMDALTHAIEAYVSTNATDFSDALAEKAITLAFRFLPEAYEHGGNRLAREKMHNASCLAGMSFNSAGLGITHSIAHAVGAKLHVSHGRMIGLVLPLVIEYNANLDITARAKEYTVTAKKYLRLSKLLGISAPNVHVGVSNFIRKVKSLRKEVGIPSSLRDLDVDLGVYASEREQIIDSVMADLCTPTNPREVTRASVAKILDQLVENKK